MTSRDFWRNNGNSDMQCRCFNMTQVEDGKLLSHLEWPKVLLELFTVLMKVLLCLAVCS